MRRPRSVSNAPRVIPGEIHLDERGEVAFVNDFRFDGIKRFYTVTNTRAGFVRAWHAHRHEAKYVTAVYGEALVCAVEVDDWERPSRTLTPFQAVLSADNPSVLFIPAGYANGFMSLSNDARLMFFSTATLEESQRDDYRFDPRYWDPWPAA